MKYKYLYLWLLAIPTMLTLTSCQKENDTNDKGKIEKITNISYRDWGDYTDAGKSVTLLKWEGNKLKVWNNTSSSGGYNEVFNYEGGRLTEILHRDGTMVLERTNFTYSNDRITTYEKTWKEYSSIYYYAKFNVSYDENGKISLITGTYNDGRTSSFRLTWQGGNLIQYVYRYEGIDRPFTTYETCTSYDSKKSWRTGLEVYAFACALTSGPSGFNRYLLERNNNELVTSYHTVYDDGTESYSTTTNTYTYDGDHVISFTNNWGTTCYIKYSNSSDPAPTTYKVTALGVLNKGYVRGAGDYVNGKTVKLLAVPDEGYHFSRWSNGSTSNPLAFTVTSDVEYQPIFEADE